MSKNKKTAITFAFFLILIAAFFWPNRFGSNKATAQESAAYVSIHEDTVWTKDTPDLVFGKPVRIENDATLTIEKGTKILFEKNYDGEDPSGIFVSNGNLVANGTGEDPIIFTSNEEDSGFVIDFSSVSEKLSFLRFVEISKGGYVETSPPACFRDKVINFFVNSAYAYDFFEYSAVMMRGGKVHIENSVFKDNANFDIAIYYDPVYDEDGNIISIFPELEVVNSNFAGDKAVNSHIDLGSYQNVYLKNNWYDSELGPTWNHSRTEKGSEIRGNLYLDSLRTNDMIADPVVIIPGIMGSATQYAGGIGQMKLDPIFHTYDNLVLSFKKNGYVENINLFYFPYEWRNKNSLTADDLKIKIQDVKNKTKISKVDLAAHSMGGLIARNYIENPNGYQNDVDQMVTLGTPHKGSPEVYLRWEAGEGFFTYDEKIAKKIFQLEAYHAGYDDLGEYIREEVKSVGELLPDYDYLQKVSDGEMKEYPNGYPQNGFLDDLNNESNLSNLSKVDFFNIIGNAGNSEKTIKKFRVIDSSKVGQWEHGMPENFYDLSTDRGIEYGRGDETVPLFSASGISSDKSVELNSNHGDLPTKAQCEVIKELSGKTDCQYANEFDRVKNVMTFGVFSPIDIQVVAPDGKWAGKNILGKDQSDMISDAYYSGHEGENEFLTIPIGGSSDNGEYKIITEGTGNGGNYKIEIANISEDENTGQAKEAAIEISGVAVSGEQEEKTVELEGDELTSPDARDEISPEITIISPENEKNYLNNQKVNIDYSVTDNKTGADKIVVEKYFDENVIVDESIDLALQKIGRHKIKIIALDEAENRSEKEAIFSSYADVDSIISNVRYYFDLGLIKKNSDKKTLIAQLNILDRHFDMLDKISSNDKINARTRAILVRIIKNTINLHIDLLEDQLQRKNRFRSVDQKAKLLLIENLNSIKIEV